MQGNKKYGKRICFSILCEQNPRFEDSGDAYLIAISGGCDSVALTRIFYSFLKKIDLRLELVHFHHGRLSKKIVFKMPSF